MDDYNVKQIGDFPSATDITDDDVLLAEQEGKTRKLSGKVLKNFCRAAIFAFTARAETAAAAAEAAKNTAAEIEQLIGEKAGVASFNGRSGLVVPENGDYTAAMVGAAPAGYGFPDSKFGFYAASSEDTDGSLATAHLNQVYAALGVGEVARFSFGSYYFTSKVGGTRGCSCTLYKIHNTINATAILHVPRQNGDTIIGVMTRQTADGVWSPVEWVNPPMTPGEEYRTTERYRGKPVYVRLYECGSFPAVNDSKTVFLNIANLDHIVRDWGTAETMGMPIFKSGKGLELEGTYNVVGSGTDKPYINARSGGTRPSDTIKLYVCVAYTKTTDN